MDREAAVPTGARTIWLRGPMRWAQEPSKWGAVIGIAWVVFWLFMLVPNILDAARRGDERGWVAVTAYLIGAAGYFLAAFVGFASAARGRRTSLPLVGAFVGVGATCVTCAAIGAEGLNLVPYVGVAFVAALPLTVALPPLLAILVVGRILLTGHADDGLLSGNLLGGIVAAIGTSMGKFSMQRDAAARRSQAEAHELEIQDERNRMARDLHDILGHSLTVISLKTDLAGKLVDRDPAAAKRELGEVQSLARSALADVRATVNNYREVSLSGELVRARGALTDAGIRAEMPSTVDEVDGELRELFAWALREASTNVVRHSGATRCRVRFERTRLEVTDDGRGAGRPGDGHGLDGLRDRASRAGALVETGPGLLAPSAERPGFTLVVREAL